MEVVYLNEMPWKDHHQRYSFLPQYHMVEDQFSAMVSFDIVTNPQPPVLTHDIESKCKLSNITKTIPIDIYR